MSYSVAPFSVKTKKPKPIIYHVNSQYDVLRHHSKNGDSTYPKETQWMWGNIITNKGRRTLDKFALVMDPGGRKAHYVTRDTFLRFFTDNFKHVYIEDLVTFLSKKSRVDLVFKQVMSLNSTEICTLLGKLGERLVQE